MISLIYVSSAVVPFSPEELRMLLATSRHNNAQLGVTGMLLYKDGNFMQAIEGKEAVIRQLHRKIRLNPRHEGLITLLEKPIERRQFSDWSMGFKNPRDPSVHALPGYSNFLNVPLTSAEFASHPTQAQKLLLTFKDKM